MEYTNCLACCVILISVLMIVLNEALPYEDRRKPLQPSFKPTPTNITVHKGQLVVLKCHIEDVGPRMVVWRREDNDVPLTIGDKRFLPEENIAMEVEKISEKESHWDLIIKDVKLEHAGTYLCQVTASKLYTQYITLTVLDEPSRSGPDVHLDGSIYVDQGGQIKLKCNASGATRAPDNIEWFLNGEKIVESIYPWRERTQILRQQRKNTRSYLSELIIDNAYLTDAGSYVCRSSDLKVKALQVHVLSSVDKNNTSKRDNPNGHDPAKWSSNLESAASVSGRYTSPPLVLLLLISLIHVSIYNKTDIILYLLNHVTLLRVKST